MSLEVSCSRQLNNKINRKLHSVERRISPRTLNKCQTERALKAKTISKSLFGHSNKRELKEDVKETTSDCQQKASNRWEFQFDAERPATRNKNFKWVADHSCDIPTFYKELSVKRSVCSKDNFEGQLPKLRYFHPKVQEENQKTDSCKKSKGQTKITDFLKERKRLSTTSMSAMKRKLRSSSQNRV